MRFVLILVSLLVAAVPARAERQSLGTFSQWGAFREGGRCFAIARPDGSDRLRGAGSFAAIGYWTARGVRGQLNVRFARAPRAGSAVILRIDDGTFELAGSGLDAWAADPRSDAAIVAAMRSGVTMSVETRAAGGAMLRDYYLLRGAATAIDAAAIACAGKKP